MQCCPSWGSFFCSTIISYCLQNYREITVVNDGVNIYSRQPYDNSFGRVVDTILSVHSVSLLHCLVHWPLKMLSQKWKKKGKFCHFLTAHCYFSLNKFLARMFCKSQSRVSSLNSLTWACINCYTWQLAKRRWMNEGVLAATLHCRIKQSRCMGQIWVSKCLCKH